MCDVTYDLWYDKWHLTWNVPCVGHVTHDIWHCLCHMMWHVTYYLTCDMKCDMWCDIWYLTHDMWHVTLLCNNQNCRGLVWVLSTPICWFCQAQGYQPMTTSSQEHSRINCISRWHIKLPRILLHHLVTHIWKIVECSGTSEGAFRATYVGHLFTVCLRGRSPYMPVIMGICTFSS